MDIERELRGKSCSAKHPQGILGEALRRVANRANHALLQIALPAEWVDDLVGVERHGVDGEVTAREVVFKLVDEADAGLGPFRIRLGAKRRDLGDVPIDLEAHGAELLADQIRPSSGGAHECFDAVGVERSREVEVLELPAQQRVAHRATHQVDGREHRASRLDDATGIRACSEVGRVIPRRPLQTSVCLLDHAAIVGRDRQLRGASQ